MSSSNLHSTTHVDSDQFNVFLNSLIQEAHGDNLPTPLRENMVKDLMVLFEEQLSNAIMRSLPSELHIEAINAMQNVDDLDQFFLNNEAKLAGVTLAQIIEMTQQQFRSDYLATTATFA